MKKTLIFSFILLASSTLAFAQLPKINLGIKGGVNYSKLNSRADLTNNSSILGYQAGILTRVGLAGMYLQPELYLGTKGSDFKLQNINNEVQTQGSVRFTTLDLPILLGTKLGSGKLNVRFMVGPVISFVIDEKTTYDQGYAAVKDYNSYKDQAVSVQAGGGVDLGNVTVDLRYESGISRLNNYGQKQNLWHLSLGLKLF